MPCMRCGVRPIHFRPMILSDNSLQGVTYPCIVLMSMAFLQAAAESLQKLVEVDVHGCSDRKCSAMITHTMLFAGKHLRSRPLFEVTNSLRTHMFLQDFKLNLLRWHLLPRMARLLCQLAALLGARAHLDHYQRDLGPLLAADSSLFPSAHGMLPAHLYLTCRRPNTVPSLEHGDLVTQASQLQMCSRAPSVWHVLVRSRQVLEETEGRTQHEDFKSFCTAHICMVCRRLRLCE